MVFTRYLARQAFSRVKQVRKDGGGEAAYAPSYENAILARNVDKHLRAIFHIQSYGA